MFAIFHTVLGLKSQMLQKQKNELTNEFPHTSSMSLHEWKVIKNYFKFNLAAVYRKNTFLYLAELTAKRISFCVAISAAQEKFLHVR